MHQIIILLALSIPGLHRAPLKAPDTIKTPLAIPSQCVEKMKVLKLRKACEPTDNPDYAICEGSFLVKFSCVEPRKERKKPVAPTHTNNPLP